MEIIQTILGARKKEVLKKNKSVREMKTNVEDSKKETCRLPFERSGEKN